MWALKTYKILLYDLTLYLLYTKLSRIFINLTCKHITCKLDRFQCLNSLFDVLSIDFEFKLTRELGDLTSTLVLFNTYNSRIRVFLSLHPKSIKLASNNKFKLLKPI